MDSPGMLLPFLAAGIVNPVLFAFMIYAAGTARPVQASGAMLAGHTLAYVESGVVLAFTVEAIADRLANPRSIDFSIEVVLGVALLWLAARRSSDQGRRPD
jgi:hypothetical protein